MQVLETKENVEHDLTRNITLRCIPATRRYEAEFPIPIHHPYITLYWTSILGPTTIALARIANTLCATSKTGELTLSAEELFRNHAGVAYIGRHSAGRRAMRRICDYGLAEWDNDTTTLTVTKHLGAIPQSQVIKHDSQGIDRHNQILSCIPNGGRR